MLFNFGRFENRFQSVFWMLVIFSNNSSNFFPNNIDWVQVLLKRYIYNLFLWNLHTFYHHMSPLITNWNKSNAAAATASLFGFFFFRVRYAPFIIYVSHDRRDFFLIVSWALFGTINAPAFQFFFLLEIIFSINFSFETDAITNGVKYWKKRKK